MSDALGEYLYNFLTSKSNFENILTLEHARFKTEREKLEDSDTAVNKFILYNGGETASVFLGNDDIDEDMKRLLPPTQPRHATDLALAWVSGLEPPYVDYIRINGNDGPVYHVKTKKLFLHNISALKAVVDSPLLNPEQLKRAVEAFGVLNSSDFSAIFTSPHKVSGTVPPLTASLITKIGVVLRFTPFFEDEERVCLGALYFGKKHLGMKAYPAYAQDVIQNILRNIKVFRNLTDAMALFLDLVDSFPVEVGCAFITAFPSIAIGFNTHPGTRFPLHDAVLSRNTKLYLCLLKAGFDISTQNRAGQTPRDIAEGMGKNFLTTFEKNAKPAVSIQTGGRGRRRREAW